MKRESVHRALRYAYGPALSVLVRILNDFDSAEEVLQQASLRALSTWNKEIPENPRAWLIRVARNIQIDDVRRQAVHSKWKQNVTVLRSEIAVTSTPEPEGAHIDDDMLRLIFTCCHPALSENAQATLTLRYILGFTTDEIARAHLTSQANVDKRLVRAKGKIRDAGIEYEVPPPKRMTERLQAVCQVIYLLFNEGFSIYDPAREIDVCKEAIRLARHVARLFRDDSEVQSLLALLLLHHSRINQRIDENNMFVPLNEQRRDLWNREEITEGLAILDKVFLKRQLPCQYQLQAAISAEHCRAKNAENTCWNEIYNLYTYLAQNYPSPVITVNRAVAAAFAEKADQAQSILDGLNENDQLANYQPLLAARGFVAEKSGSLPQAINFYRQAADQAPTEPERFYLENKVKRLSQLSSVS